MPFKLLPWNMIGISILGNPANCNTRMDWLFRNDEYALDSTPTPRYYNRTWCKQLFKSRFFLFLGEQCKHDRMYVLTLFTYKVF